MIADHTTGYSILNVEITPTMILLFVLSKIFALLLLYMALSKKFGTPKPAAEKPPKPRWRSFRILQENAFAGDAPPISELPKGLALQAEATSGAWQPRLKLVSPESSVAIRFKPVFLSGGKTIKASIGKREVFTMRLNGKSGAVELQPAPTGKGQNPANLQVVGKPKSQDWELRRDNRTIATAYPRPLKPEQGQNQRAFEVEVLESEDPLLPLTVATGIEILRRAK